MEQHMPNSFGELIQGCQNNHTIAYRTNEENISYDMFYNDCMKLKTFIREKVCGQNVVLYHSSNYEWLVIYYGLQLAGKTAILVEHQNSLTALNKICSDYNVSYVFTDKMIKLNCNILSYKKVFVDHIQTSFDKTADISTVIFTSGTSENAPKGVALSEKGLLTSSYFGHMAANIDANDILLHVIPFSHAFGLAAEVIAPLISKTMLCFGKHIGHIVKDVDKYRISALYGVPEILQGLVPYLRHLGSLKKIICGSAAPMRSTLEKYIEAGKEIRVSYGLSECSPCVSISNALVKVDDHYSGEILPCCKINFTAENEILVKGENVMLGYYDGNKLDIANITDGWLHTGDIGYLKNNSLFVTGRIKDVIVLDSGRKLVKSDLELKFKEVADADECYLFLENNLLNVVYYNCKTKPSRFRVEKAVPYGTALGRVFIKSHPLVRTTLGKVVNSPKTQISDCISTFD